LAERTGGRVAKVAVPETFGMSISTDGEGRSFLIEKIEGGDKETFLFQYMEGRFVFD
jgi:hypothetical protein